MEVRMENKKASPVVGIDPVLAEIQQRLQTQPQQWLKSLQQDPTLGLPTWKKKSMALLPLHGWLTV